MRWAILLKAEFIIYLFTHHFTGEIDLFTHRNKKILSQQLTSIDYN